MSNLRERIGKILESLWIDCNNVPTDGTIYDPIGILQDKAAKQILQVFEEREKKLLGLLKNVLEVFVDMVNQHCQVEIKGNKFYVNDMALSANERTFEILENFGLLKYGDGSKRAILNFNIKSCLAQIRERIGRDE